MEELKNYCFECMREKGTHDVCPYCGSAGDIIQPFPLLPVGSVVGDRYYIGKAMRKNSEGTTYIAYDTKEKKPCSVREFFPEAVCTRDAETLEVVSLPGSLAAYTDCRTSFNDLWRKLMRLKGLTALITVYDIFTAGNTSYAVFEELETQTLRDRLLSTPEGYIEWEQARILFMPVLSTLGTLHTSGVIHKGLHPEAFIFTSEGKLKLTDFSIAQARLSFGDLTPDIHDGYAPVEVYSEDGSIGPWTDIYSFAAVLYRTLVGATPIPAPVRAQNDQMMIPAKFAEMLPPYVINALINGMQIDPADRTRNVEQLRSNLSASPRAVSASASVYGSQADFSIPTIGDLRSAPGAVIPGKNPPPEAKPRPVASRRVPEYQPRPSGPVRRPAVAQLSDNAQDKLAEQKSNQKKRKVLIAVMVLLVVCMFAGVGLLVSGMLGSRDVGTTTTAPQQEIVQVPNLVKTKLSDFLSSPNNTVSFDIQTEDVYDMENEAGVIIAQSIRPNEKVPKGTTLKLRVSKGKREFEIPDVKGKTVEQARAILEADGYNLVITLAPKYNDGTNVPNTICESVPAAGTKVQQGASVTLNVYTEPEPETASTDENAEPVSLEEVD